MAAVLRRLRGLVPMARSAQIRSPDECSTKGRSASSREALGYEIWWANTELYVGKILHVQAGAKLSLQFHERKDDQLPLAWSPRPDEGIHRGCDEYARSHAGR